VRENKIRTSRVGRQIRITESALMEFLNTQQEDHTC
jgi:excisionase family DNA binding protein